MPRTRLAIFIVTPMKMAFLLNEYRPFGGMPRDCLRLAREATRRGHTVTIVTRSWDGEVPSTAGDPDVILLGRRGLGNAARDRHFISDARHWLGRHPQDLVLGFLRTDGLDAYFAADPCFEAKARRLKPSWFRWTPRYRRFARAEAAVFARGRPTQILLLHPHEIPVYQSFYGTESHRLHVLPPGIHRPSPEEPDHPQASASLRTELGLPPSDPLLLLAGSGFRTKGLDRALRALAALEKGHLLVAGQDKPGPFLALARRLDLASRVHFLGGRSDLPRLMRGADLLIHPAYSENTGTVLLEALVRGLPVIASGVCGFAHHLTLSGGGLALEEPFSQESLNDSLRRLLNEPHHLQKMRRAGSAYGVSQDLFSCHQRAVDLLETWGQAPVS